MFVLYPAPLFSEDHALARVIDLPLKEARQQLADAGFRVRLAPEENDPRVPRGRILWQQPAPGTTLPAGAAVELTPSAGPTNVPVPNVVGFDAELAGKVIQAGNLTLGPDDSVRSPSDAGVVLATRPGAGVGRTPGTPISLVLSAGPAPSTVPQLTGLPLADARKLLQRAGLAVGSVSARAGYGQPGTVMEQTPVAGQQIRRNARVNLVISSRGSP